MFNKKTIALCGFVLFVSLSALADEKPFQPDPVFSGMIEDKIDFLTYEQHPEGVVIRGEQGNGHRVVAAVIHTSGQHAGKIFHIDFTDDGHCNFVNKAYALTDGKFGPPTVFDVTDITRREREARQQPEQKECQQ